MLETHHLFVQVSNIVLCGRKKTSLFYSEVPEGKMVYLSVNLEVLEDKLDSCICRFRYIEFYFSVHHDPSVKLEKWARQYMSQYKEVLRVEDKQEDTHTKTRVNSRLNSLRTDRRTRIINPRATKK